MDTILFLDFGAGYMDAFSSCEFIKCGYVICALLHMNVSPQKKVQKFARGYEGFRERKHHGAYLWPGWGGGVLF